MTHGHLERGLWSKHSPPPPLWDARQLFRTRGQRVYTGTQVAETCLYYYTIRIWTKYSTYLCYWGADMKKYRNPEDNTEII